MNFESLSSLMLVSSVIVFTCAFIAHAAEWAIARRDRSAEPAASATDQQEPVLAASPTADAGAARVEGSPLETSHAETPHLEPSRVDVDRTSARPAGSSRKPGTQGTTVSGGAPPVARPRLVDLCSRVGVAMTVIAWLVTLGGVVLRGVAGQRLPWGNMVEFLTTSMVFIVAGYLLLVWRADARWLGLPITMLAAIGNGLAVTVFYVAVAPLVPALQSVWFIIHIVAAVTSGAAFNIGGLAAVLYLLKARAERRDAVHGYLRFIPSARTLDLYSYRFHAFAFPLWTFAVAAGAVWAEYAWGRYWGWDPKETWALITWVAYACYLHARATAGWKGGKAAAIALVGLITFWFNFIGINLFVSGLHSYAGV